MPNWPLTKNSIAATILLCCGGEIRAGAVVGATEFTQIANNMELAASYSEHLQHTFQQQEMIANQINAYKVQLQNVKKLDGLSWDNASGVLNQLAENMKSAQNVGYLFSQEDEAFKSLHVDYADVMKNDKGLADLTETFRKWSAYNLDAANRAANAAGMTLAQASSEQARINALKRAGASASGQLAAIDAGNALSSEMLDQLRLLKQLTAQQMDSQARYQRIQEEQRTSEVARAASVMATPKVDPKTAKAYGEIGKK